MKIAILTINIIIMAHHLATFSKIASVRISGDPHCTFSKCGTKLSCDIPVKCTINQDTLQVKPENTGSINYNNGSVVVSGNHSVSVIGKGSIFGLLSKFFGDNTVIINGVTVTPDDLKAIQSRNEGKSKSLDLPAKKEDDDKSKEYFREWSFDHTFHLKKVQLSGSSKLEGMFPDYLQEDLSVDLSGVSEIDIPGRKYNLVDLNTRGCSKINFGKSNINMVRVKCCGESEVNFNGSTAVKANLTCYGSSEIINFTVTDDLTTRASGASCIYGNSTKTCCIDKETSGSSVVSIKRV